MRLTASQEPDFLPQVVEFAGQSAEDAQRSSAHAVVTTIVFKTSSSNRAVSSKVGSISPEVRVTLNETSEPTRVRKYFRTDLHPVRDRLEGQSRDQMAGGGPGDRGGALRRQGKGHDSVLR